MKTGIYVSCTLKFLNGVLIFFSLGELCYLSVIMEYCNCDVSFNAEDKLQAKVTTAFFLNLFCVICDVFKKNHNRWSNRCPVINFFGHKFFQI